MSSTQKKKKKEKKKALFCFCPKRKFQRVEPLFISNYRRVMAPLPESLCSHPAPAL